MPNTRQARRCSSSRMGTSASRVMSGGVWSLEPAPPLVMHTVMISLPARAHFAKVPPTVNSWSSGCAWMLITRGGGTGSLRTDRVERARSGTPGVAVASSGVESVIPSTGSGRGACAGELGDLRLDLGARHRADHLVHDLTVLDEEDGRNRADTVARSQRRLLVHVDLGERHSSVRGLGQLLEHGRDGPAGTAPRRPEIDHPDAFGDGQRLVERLLGEVDDALVVSVFFVAGAHESSSCR